MTELRFHGKSDDGTHLSLIDGEGNEYSVRISDHLRATVNQPRLSAVSSEPEQEGLTVREIQKRLRAGESAESIARDGGTSVDHIERFSGPILSERIWIINQAHDVPLRKESPREPFTFIQIVLSKLAPRGVDEASLTWRTHRREDGTWNLELSYPNSAGHGIARWTFEANRHSIHPEDDNARWMLGEEVATRVAEPGLVYSNTPAPRTEVTEPVDEPVVEKEFEAPRLVAVREEPSASDVEEGIKGRAKVPSWDEIMFGIKPNQND